tara:strand:+ start:905 stop:1537 length:633 start_codon:yes stop_codon:yes gene_type:complete
MNLLAIESSSRKLSIGLKKETKITELHSDKINDTANSLPILSKKIIKDASLSFQDLDAICISSGPGSFTGLRVGMSYAKGIALALDIPVIPISTFDVLAYNNNPANLSVVIFSHGNTFYVCDYNVKNKKLFKSGLARSIIKEDLLKFKSKIIFNGPSRIFRDLKSQKLEIEFANLCIRNLIQITQDNFKLLKTKSLDNLVPEYIGNFEVK